MSSKAITRGESTSLPSSATLECESAILDRIRISGWPFIPVSGFLSESTADVKLNIVRLVCVF